MDNTTLTIEQILTVLTETPKQIATITSTLTPDELHTKPQPDEWSANEVLAHLRACADIWGESMAAAVNEENPTIEAIDPASWIETTGYRDLEFQTSLSAFRTQRGELIAMLSALPLDGWSRLTTVTGSGKPTKRAVLFFGQWLARHERTHLDQLEQIVAALRGKRVRS